jgi:2-oxo-4-hydroxy-4-carboxy--5-ureidoimidazoline (OHCU) decarboxylase
MLRMLENPNLLEHDTFTDMLLAVFHVTEELIARETLNELPNSDVDHLTNDIDRAFKTLLISVDSSHGPFTN